MNCFSVDSTWSLVGACRDVFAGSSANEMCLQVQVLAISEVEQEYVGIFVSEQKCRVLRTQVCQFRIL
uniref:Uncharacterized protein n=1 Tax=Arundo donax TaxID=35708 RepID=A0A0A9BQY1_ARUDO